MSIAELERAIGKAIPMEVPIILIAYMALMLLIGLWAAKRVKSSEDWFVGGREMGPWITALAHGSSSVGGGMYIAGPQYGWEAGASSLWAAPGDVFGPKIIKAIRGPIPYAKMMPTGGVDVDNVADWIKAGAVAVGAGSSLTAGAKTGDYQRITETGRRFVENIRQARAQLR